VTRRAASDGTQVLTNTKPAIVTKAIAIQFSSVRSDLALCASRDERIAAPLPA
jgi:hypothetical protein